jgi:cholestenol delta-isomerase
MNSRFWDRIVLQVCRTEPAIKHAVLALSSLHQLSEVREDTSVALRHQRYAEQHYQQALTAAQSLLRSSTPEDIDRVLIACLVFICYENVRGNYAASQIHTGSGRAIMAQHSERLHRISRRNDLNEIQQLFARLDIGAMMFSPCNSRYPYDVESFYRTNPNLTPDSFDTIEDARASLLDHIRWWFVVGSTEVDIALHDPYLLAMLENERLKVANNLVRWHNRLEEITSRDGNHSHILIRTLRVWHQLVTIELAANWYGSQLRFDKYIAQYARLMATAEELIELLNQKPDRGTFSFDLGITIPLFAVVQRCRDPSIRRRALKAMHAGPKQEGTWGPSSALAVERWMLFEEDGLGLVEKASDIPEWRRIVYMDASLYAELNTAEVVFEVTPSEGHESELKMGFLGTSHSQEKAARSGVKPFSMSTELSISYVARFSKDLQRVTSTTGGGRKLSVTTESPNFQ